MAEARMNGEAVEAQHQPTSAVTSDSHALVAESFRLVAPMGRGLVGKFYSGLFAQAPEMRSFFKDDVEDQSDKFFNAINLAILNLDDPDRLVEPLQELGRKHLSLGVQPAQYLVFAEVLIATLAEALGDRWSDAMENAWRDVFGFITWHMIQGARGA